ATTSLTTETAARRLRGLALELRGEPAYEEERDEWPADRNGAPEPDLRRVRNPERDVDAVGRAGEEDRRDPGDHRGADPGAPRVVARAVEQVVQAVVPCHTPLDRRPREQEAEHEQREEHAAPERVRHERVPADHDVEAGHQAQRPDQPAEVPV